jgi:hypothetical protein
MEQQGFSEAQAEIVCTVPKELLEEFQERVASSYYPGGLSEAVSDVMKKALLERGPKPEHPFGERRQIKIPRSSFILFTLPPDEHEKLQRWKKTWDRIEVFPGSRGEVWLMNETMRDQQLPKEEETP